MVLEALALVTSFANALGSVFIAKGMKESSPIVAAFYSVLTQATILTGVLATKSPSLNFTAVFLFALGGFLSLGVGRLLYFVAMKGIGVARSSAVIGSSPVFTVLLSIPILSDQPTINIVLGAVTVTSGIVLISGAKSFKCEKALVIALVSTLSYALSNVVSKAGLRVESDPFLSAQVGSLSGLLFFLFYIILTNRKGEVKIAMKNLFYFITTGVVMSVGWLTMMEALRLGSVSVVTTIVYSYPLFTLLLTHLLLKEERFGYGEVLGCIFIVIGVSFVALFK
ncbi:MAG: DMT family transporter [Nitrososphaeria archaeon]